MAFTYSPRNEDELELIVGETIEIIKEVQRVALSASDCSGRQISKQ